MNIEVIDDVDGEVISTDGAKVDRGDEISPEVNAENLKEIVKTQSEDVKPVSDVSKEMPQHIPKARFDEVISKKNELQRELEETQRRLDEALHKKEPEAPALDMKGKSDAYLSKLDEVDAALLEGETEKAKLLRREAAAINEEIQAARLESVRKQAIAETESRFTQRENANKALTVAEQVVADYPFLDTDEKALAEVMKWRDFYITMEKMSIDAAMRKAADEIAPKFAPQGDGAGGSSAATDTRTALAIARGAKDSTLQPPSTQVGTGNRSSEAARIDVSKMTDDQFENLTEAEKKRLRGD